MTERRQNNTPVTPISVGTSALYAVIGGDSSGINPAAISLGDYTIASQAIGRAKDSQGTPNASAETDKTEN
jgi:hypothetical protein